MTADDFEKLTQQLVLHEGRKRMLYPDSKGIPTVGIGHNMTKPLSDRIIAMLFAEDYIEARDACHALFKDFEQIDVIRQRVLLDMAFNLGQSKLSKFKRTIEAVNARDWEAAAVAMLRSSWAEEVGRRALRLSGMMRTGEDYTE